MSTLTSKLSNALRRSPSPSPRNSTDLSSTNNDKVNQEADKYRLLVTAGPSYDTSTHKIVHVNTSTSTTISNTFLRANIKVRIKGFRGLPSSSPSTSPYFEDPAHVKDQYSIAVNFVPKQDLPSVDAVWGNDFDHPVRERLPPGFNTAFRIVKEFIDPGLECDAYADEPWLYGPALSCWFGFRMGKKLGADAEIPSAREGKDVLREGAEEGGATELREGLGIPGNNEKRRKFFLSQANREPFIFEKDRLYSFDFYNPYLDFGNFALKLPGFSIKVVKYIDEKSHKLRYVFKNRQTGDVYLCVNFNLLWGEQLQKALAEDEDQLKAFAGAEGDRGEDDGREGDSGESDGVDQVVDRRNKEVQRDEHSQRQSGSHDTSTTHQDQGMSDKPDQLREEVQRMSISDTLQQTATADRRSGKAGDVLDELD